MGGDFDGGFGYRSSSAPCITMYKRLPSRFAGVLMECIQSWSFVRAVTHHDD